LQILGLVFAGTATDQRPDMSRFVRETLGLESVEMGGVDADVFALEDGSHFAVAGPRDGGETSRTIGFQVANLERRISDRARPDPH
jgi:glyoxylase I family protein